MSLGTGPDRWKETSILKARSGTVLTNLLRLGERLRKDGLAAKRAGDEPPLRSELFSSEQMRHHGKALAGSHGLARGRATDRLLPRLAENEGVLKGACGLLTAAVKANRRI